MVLADSGRISRVPPYLGTRSGTTFRFRLRDCHPLWSDFPDGSPIETSSRVIPTGPRNPRWTCVHPVWANPLSLATTNGITACFLFLRVLRCFTSPGLPHTTMYSSHASAALPAVGFPIRTSTDQSLVGGSPWLIAATHVLRRLLEPRHPPHTLSSLVTLNSDLPSRWLERCQVEVEIQTRSAAGLNLAKTSLCDVSSYPSYSVVRVLRPSRQLRRPAGLEVQRKSCGADRGRTDDIQLAKLALYQLSYSPIKRDAESEWA